ncbi:MAG: pilus assembly protein TadG-related protein [Gaiellales bacterium]
MTRVRHDCGQAYVITVLFISFALVGMTAAVLDVGSWFRADRALQAQVDAAALAGAQALPENPAEALSLAMEYGDKNGGGLEITDVSFSGAVVPTDTITVEADKPAPGFFARIFGIDTVTVHAKASARSSFPGEAKYVAPITVNELHPMLVCEPICFGVETEIELENKHKPGGGDAAGAFGLLNLHGSGKGSAGESEVASWILEGFPDFMPLGIYDSVPSTMFNGSHFQGALSDRVGTEVLFPVFRPPIKKSGSNAEYNIIGWVGFFITGHTGGGEAAKVQGYFTKVIWEGIEGSSIPEDDFGVRVIGLVE